MLDFDLAEMYEVKTGALKRAVRRNIERFPDDFMFELTQEEYNVLKMRIRCQIGTLETVEERGKYPKYAPFAFTEQGVAMLSSALHSETAIQVNINIIRAFVAIREYLLARASESAEIVQLRERVLLLEQTTDVNREAIGTLYNAINELSNRPPLLDTNRPRIGFKRGNE